MTVPHAPLANHLIVRLADEGVPLSAMCRALQRPFDEVLTIVTEAKEAGQIIAVPAADWPRGTRRDDRRPAMVPIRSGEIMESVGALMWGFKLTHQQATLLAALLCRPDQTKASLHAAVCRDGANPSHPKIVDVLICKIRPKLLAKGIVIETVWGRGFRTMQAAKGAEKHLCPLPFDIVDREINQRSMPGELVLDPFGGLMTVPYRAVLKGRRGIGVELSPTYFRDGMKYCEAAARQVGVPSLFDLMAVEADQVEVAE